MTLYEDVAESVFKRVCVEYLIDPMLTLKPFGPKWTVFNRNDDPIMEWTGHFEGTVTISTDYVDIFYRMKKEYLGRMKTIRGLLHDD